MLLLLLALVQAPGVRPGHHLDTYLAAVSGYASGERVAAMREVRSWRSVEIDAAISALYGRASDLRAVPAVASDIDFRLVEAAVLLHAELGLLHLQDLSWVDGRWHLGKSVALFEWSREAARRLRERAAKRRVYGPQAGLPEPTARALDVRERITPRDFYVALAASVLVFGQSLSARDLAERAIAAAPLDAEAYFVLGCAAEYLAEEQALKEDASTVRQLRGEAEAAFRKALAVDPVLAEAHLRLGHVLLAGGRLAEAEPVLVEAESRAADDGGRYLARLFLGRAAEAHGRRGDAATLYRRALEALPSGQTAHLALAHLLEKEGNLEAARAQVTSSLAASRRGDRPSDPFWVYVLGNAGLARAALDRLNAVIAP